MERLRGLYKSKVQFVPTKEDVRKNAVRDQKKKREESFYLQRHKSIAEEENQASPKLPREPRQQKKHDTRLEKLLKWKAEKERLLEQQNIREKKRPPFKVGVYHYPPVYTSTNIPDTNVRSTVVKCTTEKKKAAAERAKDHRHVSAAAASLATLSCPQDTVRITRSRAASAREAEKKQPGTALKKQTATPSVKTKQVAGSKPVPSSVKPQTSSKPIRSSKRIASATHSSEDSQPLASNTFAPVNHKFKAPKSCKPLPSLPLKKKQQVNIPLVWPTIPGVSVLSPDVSSPLKVTKGDVTQSRRLLRFTVKPHEDAVIEVPKGNEHTSAQLLKTPSAGTVTERELTPKILTPVKAFNVSPFVSSFSRKSETGKPHSKRNTPSKISSTIEESLMLVPSPRSLRSRTPHQNITMSASERRSTSSKRGSVKMSGRKILDTDSLNSSVDASSQRVQEISESVPETGIRLLRGKAKLVRYPSSAGSPVLQLKAGKSQSSVNEKENIHCDSNVKADLPESTNLPAVDITLQKAEISEGAMETPRESIPRTETKKLQAKTKLVRHHSGSPAPRLKDRKSPPTVSGKENVSFVSSIQEKLSDSDNSASEVEHVKKKASRMSIHEPSPPVSTPQKLPEGMVPAQFSPYITTARGKNRHSMRRDSLEPVYSETALRVKQVEGFRNVVERETTRLLNLCDRWEKCMEEAPSAVQDQILGTVGQARLLTKDKFQQFRNLINKFADGQAEEKMRADDLTGFWEMILVTVENMNQRFARLEDLKANGWKEKIIKMQPMEKKSRTQPIKQDSKRLVKPVSRIKALIEADRKKKELAKEGKNACNETDVTTFNGGFFVVESPQKTSVVSTGTKPKLSISDKSGSNTPPSTPRMSTRRSLLQQVLTNSTSRFRTEHSTSICSPSSPSVKGVGIQMRASLLGRRLSSSNESCTTPPSDAPSDALPSKSILKSGAKTACDSSQRNRVMFHNSFSSLSPLALFNNSLPASGNIKTSSSSVVSSSSKGRRQSLIPRLTSLTPLLSKVSTSSCNRSPASADGRPSLLPMRDSLIPTKPFASGDLIDWSTPPSGKA